MINLKNFWNYENLWNILFNPNLRNSKKITRILGTSTTSIEFSSSLDRVIKVEGPTYKVLKI